MEAESPPPEKQCLDIDDTIKCFDMNPTPEKNCSMLNGVAFCENGEKSKTFRDERKKFLGIMFYPKLRKNEAKEIENNIVQFTIGLVLSALVFTLSLFIKDIVDLIAIFFLPSSTTILSLIIIVIVLIAISLVLAFIQTRVGSALEETELLEKVSEKNPVEALKAIVE